MCVSVGPAEWLRRNPSAPVSLSLTSSCSSFFSLSFPDGCLSFSSLISDCFFSFFAVSSMILCAAVSLNATHHRWRCFFFCGWCAWPLWVLRHVTATPRPRGELHCVCFPFYFGLVFVSAGKWLSKVKYPSIIFYFQNNSLNELLLLSPIIFHRQFLSSTAQ